MITCLHHNTRTHGRHCSVHAHTCPNTAAEYAHTDITNRGHTRTLMSVYTYFRHNTHTHTHITILTSRCAHCSEISGMAFIPRSSHHTNYSPSPIAPLRSTLYVRSSPFAPLRPLLSVLPSPFAALRSPLFFLPSPFSPRPSPFAALRSPFDPLQSHPCEGCIRSIHVKDASEASI